MVGYTNAKSAGNSGDIGDSIILDARPNMNIEGVTA